MCGIAKRQEMGKKSELIFNYFATATFQFCGFGFSAGHYFLLFSVILCILCIFYDKKRLNLMFFA